MFELGGKLAGEGICEREIFSERIWRRNLLAEEFKEEKLIRAKAWIVKWGVGFTINIVILWPLLSLPTGQFSKGYWGFAKRTWTIQGYAIHEICSCNASVHASVQFQQPPDGKC